MSFNLPPPKITSSGKLGSARAGLSTSGREWFNAIRFAEDSARAVYSELPSVLV